MSKNRNILELGFIIVILLSVAISIILLIISLEKQLNEKIPDYDIIPYSLNK